MDPLKEMRAIAARIGEGFEQFEKQQREAAERFEQFRDRSGEAMKAIQDALAAGIALLDQVAARDAAVDRKAASLSNLITAASETILNFLKLLKPPDPPSPPPAGPTT